MKFTALTSQLLVSSAMFAYSNDGHGACIPKSQYGAGDLFCSFVFREHCLALEDRGNEVSFQVDTACPPVKTPHHPRGSCKLFKFGMFPRSCEDNVSEASCAKLQVENPKFKSVFEKDGLCAPELTAKADPPVGDLQGACSFEVADSEDLACDDTLSAAQCVDKSKDLLPNGKVPFVMFVPNSKCEDVPAVASKQVDPPVGELKGACSYEVAGTEELACDDSLTAAQCVDKSKDLLPGGKVPFVMFVPNSKCDAEETAVRM